MEESKQKGTLMNTLKKGKSAALYIAIMMAVAMTACQTDTMEEAVPSEFDSVEYAVFDYEDSMDAFRSATLEEPMEMDPEVCSGEVLGEGRRFGPCAPLRSWGPRIWRHRAGNHLRGVLGELALTDEQKEQIRDLMAAHHDCVRGPLAAICATSQEIIQAVNEEVRAIIESLRNGEIDRAEAWEQLRELNQRAREAIRKDPDNLDQLVALCECKLTLFDNIRTILDEEQQGIWDDWVAGLEGPCFSDEEVAA